MAAFEQLFNSSSDLEAPYSTYFVCILAVADVLVGLFLVLERAKEDA
jgi:hypothetical protein